MSKIKDETMSAEPKIGDYRLTRTWDFARADYGYRLEKYEFPVNAITGVLHPEMPPQWFIVATSEDKAWADRTAYYLKIECQDKEDN